MSVELQRVGSVVVVEARGVLSMHDANAIMDLIGATQRSGTNYAVLMDARGLAVPTADVRRRLIEGQGKPDEIAADRGRHVAIVLNNILLRATLTSLRWFLPKILSIQLSTTAVEAATHLVGMGHPQLPGDEERLMTLASQTDRAWRHTTQEQGAPP
jgi:hypothetical protein